ncbi:MAG: SDR family NAD(P)-dependent oxidoreductase, partial [Acidimicrobiia bacterium]
MAKLLQGKVAIVTGASRGIGEFIARRFAEEGANVVVSARTEQQTDERLPGTIHDTVSAINEFGGTALAVRADLSKPEERELLVETTKKELGPPDILVNNAAVTYYFPVEEFPEKRYRLMLEVLVRAPFELSQLVLPSMKEKKSGWICNISSAAAIHP